MLNHDMLALGSRRSTIRELFEYGKQLSEKIGKENVFDYSLGNPSIPAPDAVGAEIKSLVDGVSPITLHGYTSAEGDKDVRDAIANHISASFGIPAKAESIYMTVGAAAALTCSLRALINPGDEVIVLAPYFPEYKVFIEGCGGRAVVALCREDDFKPDISELDSKITEKTIAVIVNSPNNPTGAVYNENDITEIAELLKRKSLEYGNPIFIIADEPYRELVYGEKTVPFIPNFYDNTIVCYSYSKSLSIPGERIGYIFVPDSCCEAQSVFHAVAGAGRSLGYVCAPSLLQRLVARCVGMTSDISCYLENRDILTKALREYGYTVPEANGAFYLFVKSPIPDAIRFSDIAKELGLLLVPSDDFGYPGFVRIAYCQKKEMIIRSLPKFKELIEKFND